MSRNTRPWESKRFELAMKAGVDKCAIAGARPLSHGLVLERGLWTRLPLLSISPRIPLRRTLRITIYLFRCNAVPKSTATPMNTSQKTKALSESTGERAPRTIAITRETRRRYKAFARPVFVSPFSHYEFLNFKRLHDTSYVNFIYYK